MSDMKIASGLRVREITSDTSTLKGLELLPRKDWHLPFPLSFIGRPRYPLLQALKDRFNEPGKTLLSLLNEQKYRYATCVLPDTNDDVPKTWDARHSEVGKWNSNVLGHVDSEYKDHYTAIYYPADKKEKRLSGTWIADPKEFAEKALEESTDLSFLGTHEHRERLITLMRIYAHNVCQQPFTVNDIAEVQQSWRHIYRAAVESSTEPEFWKTYQALLVSMGSLHVQEYEPGRLFVASGRLLHGRMPLSLEEVEANEDAKSYRAIVV